MTPVRRGRSASPFSAGEQLSSAADIVAHPTDSSPGQGGLRVFSALNRRMIDALLGDRGEIR